jgi:hypothetical protein
MQLHQIADSHREQYLARGVLRAWASHIHRLKSDEELVAWQGLRKENIVKKLFFQGLSREVAAAKEACAGAANFASAK